MEIITVRDFRNNMKDYMSNTEDGKIYRIGTRDTLLISEETINEYIHTITTAKSIYDTMMNINEMFEAGGVSPTDSNDLSQPVNALEAFLMHIIGQLGAISIAEKESFDKQDITEYLRKGYKISMHGPAESAMITFLKELFVDTLFEFDADDTFTLRDLLVLIANISSLPKLYLKKEYLDGSPMIYDYIIFLSDQFRSLGYGRPYATHEHQSTFVKSYIDSYL